MVLNWKAQDFLKRNGIYAGNIDLEKECQKFIDEMERGLKP